MTEHQKVSPGTDSGAVITGTKRQGGDGGQPLGNNVSGEPPIAHGNGVKRDVLLVAFSEDDRMELAASFSAAGWGTHTCAGPPHVPCPLVAAGHPCELRTAADVAVVTIDPDHRLSGGQLPIASCAACGVSPGVIVVQRDMDEVETEGHTAIVGGTSKREVVVKAAESLLAAGMTTTTVAG